MDELPLDARLLANAVIELNIARHILALYPKEHQLVQLSLDKTFAILAELFALRSEITLAVAKDTLIVDGRHLDQRNPVNREFALALSRMSVAFMTLLKGVTREEVYGLFRFLLRETDDLCAETLPEILAEYGLRHILVEPLDYRRFAFAEDRTVADGSDRFLLERHIKTMLDGELPAESVREVVESVEPQALAGLLNQAGPGVAHEATYDTVVSSYLRTGAGRQFSSTELQRLMTFVAGLRPELKQQFLASSIRAVSADLDTLGHALEGVSVDNIIEFFGGLDRGSAALSEPLSTLIAQFARTGVELPGGGLSLDDVPLSRAAVSIFKDGSGQHTPAAYQEEMRLTLDGPRASDPGAVAECRAMVERELDEEYVRYCHVKALLALLESPLPQLIALEDEDAYASSFLSLAESALAAGQYAQLLELFTRFEDLEARGRHRDVLDAVRGSFEAPEFLARVVESFGRHGRANRAGAAAVCAYYGGAIAPALFDLLTTEARTHVRRMLLQLLAGLGERAADEIVLRLGDERWHVRRNALYLLAESALPCEPGLVAALARDREPRVRLEAARCLTRAGDPAGVAALRELILERESGVAEAAIAAAGALRAEELIPDLVAVAQRSGGAAGSRSRLRALRALRQIGGGRAADALRRLLKVRFLFPGDTRRFRADVRKALQRLEASPDRGTGEAP